MNSKFVFLQPPVVSTSKRLCELGENTCSISFSFRMMASCMQVLLFMGEARHWGCGCALRFIDPASTPVCRVQSGWPSCVWHAINAAALGRWRF